VSLWSLWWWWWWWRPPALPEHAPEKDAGPTPTTSRPETRVSQGYSRLEHDDRRQSQGHRLEAEDACRMSDRHGRAEREGVPGCPGYRRGRRRAFPCPW
jgi:hypothetical protein